MKFPKRAVPGLIFLLLTLPAGRAFALKTERLARFSPASGKTSGLEVASGSAIVKFRAGVSTSAASAALEPLNFHIAATFPRFNFSSVILPDGLSVSAGLSILDSLPQVETAFPNRAFKPSRVPNDPFVSRQYALAQVQAFGAWEYETGFSSRVTVAVLDTGIDGSHPDLAGKFVLPGRVFDPLNGDASNDATPTTAACNHATRAAGLAAAVSDNSAGVAGMSWGAKLLSLKVFADADCTPGCSDEAAYGSCSASETAIAAAINDAIALHNTAAAGKMIINMSIGDAGTCSAPLQTTVSAAAAAGIMMFAAAGNDGASVMDSPANCDGVIAVGATDLHDSLASFSNSDTLMISKGLTAPGVDLYTTDLNGGYASASGTSFSSPMAAGLAALLWSAKPEKTASGIWSDMKNSADDLGSPGPDRDFGWGRMNAYKALCRVVTCRNYYAGTEKAVAYPNPFRPKTHNIIAFKIDETLTGSGLEIKIYTSEGELVKKLEGMAWDGKNEAGAAVATGVYLFRVKTDKGSATGKFALLR